MGPTSVAVRDLNGDGIPDIAAVNFLSQDVSVLLGKGDGTFQAAVNYPVGYIFPNAEISILAVSDFNGDAIADLAVACAGGVRVLLGKGDGTFQNAPISYVAGAYPSSLAVGDFNGHGLPDLVVSNWNLNNISILLDDGKWVP
jgi:hypothetical protein